jgi:hypothetical protein
VSQRGGVLFLEKRYHECGECHAPLLLARSVIEEHVAAAHHQLTPAQYNARHMQVGYRYSTVLLTYLLLEMSYPVHHVGV